MLQSDRDSNSISDVEHLQEVRQEESSEGVSLFKFFSFLSPYDKVLLIAGTISSLLAGAILPSISLIMGNVASAFTPGGQGATDIISEMNFIASYVILIATCLFIFSYFFFAFWQHLAENITSDLRQRYLRALLRQEVAFFEKNKVEQIPSQMSEIFETVKASIGEKISNLIFAVATCLAGICYALTFGPTFALVCLAYLPFLLAIIGIFGSMVRKTTI